MPNLSIQTSASYRDHLLRHSFFENIKKPEYRSQKQLQIVLGQYWHLVHFFPRFLGRLISSTDRIKIQTAIAKILSQETGEGELKQAHEVIYLDTMAKAGFDPELLKNASPNMATRNLLALFEAFSARTPEGLGLLFATETIDLKMVSGIGYAVKKLSGLNELEWVDIHVKQEPDHVDCATDTLFAGQSEQEHDLISKAAELSWELWSRFYDELNEAIKPIPMPMESETLES